MENQNIRFEVCGTTEFREGKLDGYATVRPVGKFLSSSPLILTVCTNCGESLNFNRLYKLWRKSPR